MTAPTWHHPAVGDYYRWYKNEETTMGAMAAGTIGLVTRITEDGIRLEIPGADGALIFNEEELVQRLEYLPDGALELVRRIEKLSSDVGELGTASGDLRDRLLKLSAHVNIPAGELSETALVPAVASLEETRGAVASIRNDMARIHLEVKRKQTAIKSHLQLQARRLEALMVAQAAELESKVGDLSGMIKRAEEAIATINLYLGKNERIVQVAQGKPAARDAKIHIRQLVLYADEECAVAADEGGIDFQQLEEFDRWVAVPAHRRQVLPEEKGVVAIKVRRNERITARLIALLARGRMPRRTRRTRRPIFSWPTGRTSTASAPTSKWATTSSRARPSMTTCSFTRRITGRPDATSASPFIPATSATWKPWRRRRS